VEVLVITFRTNTTYRQQPYDDNDNDGGGNPIFNSLSAKRPVLIKSQAKGQTRQTCANKQI
jgi:hypothetical protein